jgi:hypothetical protein
LRVENVAEIIYERWERRKKVMELGHEYCALPNCSAASKQKEVKVTDCVSDSVSY